MSFQPESTIYAYVEGFGLQTYTYKRLLHGTTHLIQAEDGDQFPADWNRMKNFFGTKEEAELSYYKRKLDDSEKAIQKHYENIEAHHRYMKKLDEQFGYLKDILPEEFL